MCKVTLESTKEMRRAFRTTCGYAIASKTKMVMGENGTLHKLGEKLVVRASVATKTIGG